MSQFNLKKINNSKSKRFSFITFLAWVGSWFSLRVCVSLLSNVNEMVCSSELYTIFVFHNRMILFYFCCWGKNVHFQEYSIRVTHTGRRRPLRRYCRWIWRAPKKLTELYVREHNRVLNLSSIAHREHNLWMTIVYNEQISFH